MFAVVINQNNGMLFDLQNRGYQVNRVHF